MQPCDEPVKQNYFCMSNHIVTKKLIENKKAISFTFDA